MSDYHRSISPVPPGLPTAATRKELLKEADEALALLDDCLKNEEERQWKNLWWEKCLRLGKLLLIVGVVVGLVWFGFRLWKTVSGNWEMKGILGLLEWDSDPQVRGHFSDLTEDVSRNGFWAVYRRIYSGIAENRPGSSQTTRAGLAFLFFWGSRKESPDSEVEASLKTFFIHGRDQALSPEAFGRLTGFLNSHRQDWCRGNIRMCWLSHAARIYEESVKPVLDRDPKEAEGKFPVFFEQVSDYRGALEAARKKPPEGTEGE